MNEGMDTNISNLIHDYQVIMNCNSYYKAWPRAMELSVYIEMVYSGKLDNHMEDLVRIGSTTMTVYNVINVALSTFIAVHEKKYTGDPVFDSIKQAAINYFGDSLYYLNLELGTEYE